MRQTPVAPTELIAAFAEANPRSRAAFDRATRVLPGGVTHEGRHLAPFPPYITHARGAHKWDLDNHEYVDYAMGHGALILGHAHPAIVEAVTRQVARGTHLGASHLLEVEWAERIHALVPGAELVRFTSSGTEATLLALRIARVASGRPKVLKFQGHFHGWHDAVMPGQSPPWESMPPGIPASVAQETVVVPPDLQVVHGTLRGDPEIGTVIIEPSGGSWGTIPLPAGFLRDLRTLTASRGVILIFDEVITGFRWAPGGVQQTSGVTADMVTMAKILAGGLPGGAVSGRRDLLEHVSLTNGGQRIHHPGTFNANPLSAAAGIACLDLVRDPALQGRCDRMAADMRAGMNEVLARRGVRGAAYGESSVFHLVFDAALTPGDPRSITKISGQTLKEQRRVPTVSIAMLLEGIYLFALGGFLSAAHSTEDVTRTIAALDGTVRRLQGLLPA
jgi:glutamate-1-semialdehyde 2,1-aminomutase